MANDNEEKEQYDKEAVPANDTTTAPKPAPVDPDSALSSILLGQHEGDAAKLLEGVFDFLRRRTNFFRQDNARERAAAAFEAARARDAAAPAGDLTAEQVAGAAAGAAGATTAAVAVPEKKEEKKEEAQEQAGPSGVGAAEEGEEEDKGAAAAASSGLLSESFCHASLPLPHRSANTRLSQPTPKTKQPQTKQSPTPGGAPTSRRTRGRRRWPRRRSPCLCLPPLRRRQPGARATWT